MVQRLARLHDAHDGGLQQVFAGLERRGIGEGVARQADWITTRIIYVVEGTMKQSYSTSTTQYLYGLSTYLTTLLYHRPRLVQSIQTTTHAHARHAHARAGALTSSTCSGTAFTSLSSPPPPAPPAPLASVADLIEMRGTRSLYILHSNAGFTVKVSPSSMSLPLGFDLSRIWRGGAKGGGVKQDSADIVQICRALWGSHNNPAMCL